MTASGSAETKVSYKLRVNALFLFMFMNVLAACVGDNYLETQVKAGAFTLRLRCHAAECPAQSAMMQIMMQ